MPDEIVDFVGRHSDFTQKKFNDLEAGIKGVDLIYMTRVQRERFARPEDYERVKGRFVLTPRLLNSARLTDEHDEDVRGKFLEIKILMGNIEMDIF